MKIIMLLIIFVVRILAVSIDDVDIGDIYYINGGWIDEDRRVIVVRVSQSKGKIKVRASNGDTEWVYPSKLLTKQENENRNFLQNPLTLLAGAALMSASTSKEHNEDGGYYVRVKNNCDETMKIAIYYKTFYGDEWKADGWWELKPNNGKTKLTSDDKPITTKSAVIYFYAESKYGNRYKTDGYKKVYF